MGILGYISSEIGGVTMFSENLKMLRKQRGMSQEALAKKLNVVRQTISKWEKGLSVPDAELLTRISDVFEVPVSQLLGTKIEEEKNVNEVAVQLALLNEQLADRSRRNRKILKIILSVLLAVMGIIILTAITAYINFTVKHTTTRNNLTTVELKCTLEGEEYLYDITYDEQYNVIEAGGSAFIANHVETEKCSDANILIARIEDYFKDHGGSYEETEVD